ncbi:hypothetical protein TNCV_2134041 [Trichonephila clavipes]|nr:hypothetical protein TNCV_2134041 [Trichonephila clavipes]
MRDCRQHFYAACHSSSLLVVGVQQTLPNGSFIVDPHLGGNEGCDSFFLFVEGVLPALDTSHLFHDYTRNYDNPQWLTSVDGLPDLS